jgi:hypothetical protein
VKWADRPRTSRVKGKRVAGSIHIRDLIVNIIKYYGNNKTLLP